jgi:hypothetical protein
VTATLALLTVDRLVAGFILAQTMKRDCISRRGIDRKPEDIRACEMPDTIKMVVAYSAGVAEGCPGPRSFLSCG